MEKDRYFRMLVPLLLGLFFLPAAALCQEHATIVGTVSGR